MTFFALFKVVHHIMQVRWATLLLSYVKFPNAYHCNIPNDCQDFANLPQRYFYLGHPVCVWCVMSLMLMFWATLYVCHAWCHWCRRCIAMWLVVAAALRATQKVTPSVLSACLTTGTALSVILWALTSGSDVWLKKGLGPVDVISTGWWQEVHPASRSLHQLPLMECTFPPLLFLHWWDSVKQDVWRGRVMGELATQREARQKCLA